ncbi:MAG: alpha/beta hydrolase [Candidatus Obscuribacterales bacterium]|nr:alpha/beta hydrolase [Candidatus Obscuribacterales bacterium]
MSSVETLSKGIESATKAFLEHVNSQPGPQIYQIPVTDGRAAFVRLQNSVNVVKLPADIEDLTFPVGPGGKVDVRIVRPMGVTSNLPVVIYSHGGGWVFGDKDIYDRLLRDLAAGAQAAVVFVDFDRSPEARYPVAIEQIYAVAKHVFENSESLRVDKSKFAVAGDSVGGNMTAVLTMLAKERGGPKIGAQVLFYPVTNASFDTGSYREFATKHFLSLEAMKWFWDQYIPDASARKDPTASPLQASIEQLKGLPPALVLEAEFDVLRDEGEAYAHKLIEAGVRVEAARFMGTIHDFVMLNPLAETPATRSAIALACDFLKRKFSV